MSSTFYFYTVATAVLITHFNPSPFVLVTEPHTPTDTLFRVGQVVPTPPPVTGAVMNTQVAQSNPSSLAVVSGQGRAHDGNQARWTAPSRCCCQILGEGVPFTCGSKVEMHGDLGGPMAFLATTARDP